MTKTDFNERRSFKSLYSRTPAQKWAVARNFYLFRLRGMLVYPPPCLNDNRLSNITDQIYKLQQAAIKIVETEHATYKQELKNRKASKRKKDAKANT